MERNEIVGKLLNEGKSYMKMIMRKIEKNDMFISVISNLLLKPLGMFISLFYTPFLLDYLGKEQYGVWVTILSVINWVYYFDVGIGNGLRNRITVEISNNEYSEVKKSVSTAYVTLFGIIVMVMVAGLGIGRFVKWERVFNTSLNVTPVLVISFLFICINFLLSLQKNGFYAIQKSEIVALSGIIIQAINLVGVLFLMILDNSEYNLISMAILFGLSSLVVNVLFTAILGIKNKCFLPSIRCFEKSKLKEICSLGLKFFFIQIAVLVLFTTDSLIISNLFTPELVTPYNTVYKAFGVVMSVFTAIMAPYWSRFTVAKVKKDFLWMKKTLRSMRLLWLIFSIALVGLVPFYQSISDIWLGRHLYYESGLVIAMAIYYISYIYSSICSTALNGLGDINVQLICAVCSAVINIPLSIFLAVNCGMATTGICLGTVISLLFGDIVFTIQLRYIIKKGLGR